MIGDVFKYFISEVLTVVHVSFRAQFCVALFDTRRRKFYTAFFSNVLWKSSKAVLKNKPC